MSSTSCANHADVEASGACTQCGGLFCHQCLVSCGLQFYSLGGNAGGFTRTAKERYICQTCTLELLEKMDLYCSRNRLLLSTTIIALLIPIVLAIVVGWLKSIEFAIAFLTIALFTGLLLIPMYVRKITTVNEEAQKLRGQLK